jgi:hypothetical protein
MKAPPIRTTLFILSVALVAAGTAINWLTDHKISPWGAGVLGLLLVLLLLDLRRWRRSS